MLVILSQMKKNVKIFFEKTNGNKPQLFYLSQTRPFLEILQKKWFLCAVKM